VEVRNETALANAIHFVITNPSKTIQLKESAYNFAMSNYSNKTMFAKYQSVFEGLTNKLN
jgi:hypothetical protein